MIHLTVEEIERLHTLLVERTGGSDGLRDRGLLESAVFACVQTFDDNELYPTIEEKAAHLAFGLCKNHPFIDGNKRIAVLAMLVTLKLNGVNCSHAQKELIELGYGIADGSMNESMILHWIESHEER